MATPTNAAATITTTQPMREFIVCLLRDALSVAV